MKIHIVRVLLVFIIGVVGVVKSRGIRVDVRTSPFPPLRDPCPFGADRIRIPSALGCKLRMLLTHAFGRLIL
ncbi:unnamed protein product [Arctia plantaginis]|uniref:Uncharacterized protein n=1 Tax=Arctia plantaginis TaxID=874455 RepID=A0A8S0YLP0_ARCPL|nr:unnamed protein product [Arctia plantaginis]